MSGVEASKVVAEAETRVEVAGEEKTPLEVVVAEEEEAEEDEPEETEEQRAARIAKMIEPTIFAPLPEETEEERRTRISELVGRNMQPLRRQYVVERVKDGAAPDRLRDRRGQNKKRPREGNQERVKSAGDPVGRVDEVNVLPMEVAVALRKRQWAFATRAHFDKTPEESDVSTHTRGKEPRKLVDFRNKVYIAPLTTVGNLPFRRCLIGLGADITCGEMALAQNLIDGQTSEWALLRRHSDEKVFGVQLSAAHGDQMGRACELIREHCTLDFVDVNMGCPIDLVCQKGAGASLMKRHTKAGNVVDAALSQLDCSLTVKMRTGWSDGDPLAHTLAGYVQSWSSEWNGAVSAVFVHGRSRTARYSRQADWSYIERVAVSQDDSVRALPIIGNGDILSHLDYEAKRAAAPSTEPCAMLARGALIKPWLPTEIKESRTWDISSSERLDIIKTFVRYGLEHWGSDDCGRARVRRFLLEWLSFLHRYTPAGMLEQLPQRMNDRPPAFVGRNDLETLMASSNANDWLKITELVLGPTPDSFKFEPKHKANSFAAETTSKKPSDWG